MASATIPAPVKALATAAVLLAAANWLTFKATGYPVVYCQTPSFLAELYLAGGTVLIYGAVAYTALMLFRGQNIPAFGGAAFIFGIIQLPNVLEAIFRLGGDCG